MLPSPLCTQEAAEKGCRNNQTLVLKVHLGLVHVRRRTQKLAAKGLPSPRFGYKLVPEECTGWIKPRAARRRAGRSSVDGPPRSIRWVEVVFGASPPRQRIVGRRADVSIRTHRPTMGWAGNRVSPQITAAPRFPVGSRVLLKPADPKGRKLCGNQPVRRVHPTILH